MRSPETKKRELSALNSIDDNAPKHILSLDPETNNFDGIIQSNAIDWLAEK
jgi:predicted AAA+ superfamily ATPase